MNNEATEQNTENIVIIQECAAGNESVGTEWCESAIFPATATLADVLKWRKSLPSPGGRLMITIPQNVQNKEGSDACRKD